MSADSPGDLRGFVGQGKSGGFEILRLDRSAWRRLKVRLLPTMLVVSPDGEILSKIP
jgi:hypothetical protein